MTAEVAILNPTAVAIAADSAVTIGRGRKIYNSAIKVFTLSKVAPVGIMVYGNAGLLEVPWETIIKIYRSELKHQTFPRLADYASHFIDYLPKQARFFPADLQDKSIEANIAGYLASIRDDILRLIERRIKEHGHIDDADTVKVLKHSIKRHHDSLAKLPFVNGINAKWESSLKRKIQARLPKAIEEIFQKLPLDSTDKKQLLEIGVFIHGREIISDDHSGVVICGFGSADVYPSLVTHLIDGLYNDRLKFVHSDGKSFTVKDGSDCSIIPFAQDDMVTTFMEGINPSVNRFTNRYLQQMFSRLSELLTDDILVGELEQKNQIRKKFKEDSNKLLGDFLQQLGTHKHKEHVSPILDMVQVLPKDELAEMAEALVNLTAFKRRMTDELETVGGPVDVAVISKGDGFVWVKRKHYFPRELNQQFFANYFRDINHDAG